MTQQVLFIIHEHTKTEFGLAGCLQWAHGVLLEAGYYVRSTTYSAEGFKHIPGQADATTVLVIFWTEPCKPRPVDVFRVEAFYPVLQLSQKELYPFRPNENLARTNLLMKVRCAACPT